MKLCFKQHLEPFRFKFHM